MTALKKVAEKKFTAALQGISAEQNAKCTKYRHVLAVVPFIYDTTPGKDRSLRDQVVAYMAKHWRAVLTLPGFKAFVAGNVEFIIEVVEARRPGPTMIADTAK
jgi:hypothetical protein